MNIELRHLRYFIAVAEELHFGKAAERLNISQPPLSQQIQALESEIGARLLERTNRSVSLTPAGQMFLKGSYQIMAQVKAVATRASRMEKGELGEISIGFTSTTPFMHLVTLSLRQFRENYPEVGIHMHQMNTKQQISPLLTVATLIWELCVIRCYLIICTTSSYFVNLLFWQFMKGILYLNTKKQA